MFNIYEIQDDEGTTSYMQVWTGASSYNSDDEDLRLFRKERITLRRKGREMKLREIMRVRDLARASANQNQNQH